MFLWTTPRTRAAFGMSAEQAEQTKVLAANQGLYNGFLAAGLAWSLLAPSAYAHPLALFFLACVLVAGIYGGFTANRRIWLLQALPAARHCWRSYSREAATASLRMPPVLREHLGNVCAHLRFPRGRAPHRRRS